jgi:hypothetical protein
LFEFIEKLYIVDVRCGSRRNLPFSESFSEDDSSKTTC